MTALGRWREIRDGRTKPREVADAFDGMAGASTTLAESLEVLADATRRLHTHAGTVVRQIRDRTDAEPVRVRPASAWDSGEGAWVWACTCHGWRSRPWLDRPTLENATAEHDWLVSQQAGGAR